MKNDEIFYQLSIEDIQSVANQELERDLSPAEIEKVKNLVDEKIGWYEAIADSIEEVTNNQDVSE